MQNTYELPPRQLKFLKRAQRKKRVREESMRALIQKENLLNETSSQKSYFLKPSGSRKSSLQSRNSPSESSRSML